MNNSYRLLAHPMTALVLFLFVTACSSVSAVKAQSEDPPEQQPIVQEAPQAQASDLADYVGSYEARQITLNGLKLYYKREGMPSAVELKQIEEDHYEIVIPPGAQVRGPAGGEIPTFRFNRNTLGQVESLSMVNQDKSVLATYTKAGQTTVH